MNKTNNPILLKPDRPVGIVGYGAYVPRYRLPAKEVARVWSGRNFEMPIKEKAVAGLDEDTATMSIEAARNALARADRPTSHSRRLGRQQIASLCRQAYLDHCCRSSGHRPFDPGGRLGIRL